MALSQNQMIATALRHSFAFLSINYRDRYVDGSNRRHEFICHALAHTAKTKLVPPSVADAAQILVSGRLEGAGTLQDWIEDHYPRLRKEIEADHKTGSTKMQATRAAWVWALICELEGENDSH